MSKKGRDYTAQAIGMIKQSFMNDEPYTERLNVEIDLYVPDKRKRDIDNVTKAALDVISKSDVWEDDELIDKLTLTRIGLDREHPRLEVRINVR